MSLKMGQRFAINKTLRLPIVRTPSRTLNSAGFQPNPLRPCLVSYSVRIQSALSVAGGQAGLVQLLSDENSTPTTVRAEVRGSQTGTVSAGLAINDDSGAALEYMVPAGHYVKIIDSGITGSPTFTIAQQTEIDL